MLLVRAPDKQLGPAQDFYVGLRRLRFAMFAVHSVTCKLHTVLTWHTAPALSMVQAVNRASYRALVPVPLVTQSCIMNAITNNMPPLASINCNIAQTLDSQQATLTFRIVTSDKNNSLTPEARRIFCIPILSLFTAVPGS